MPHAWAWADILDSLQPSATLFLTEESRSLALAAVDVMTDYGLWVDADTGDAVTEAEWDTILAAVDRCLKELMLPVQSYPIGALAWSAVAEAEDGWLLCDGTIYNSVDYPDLAAKLGTTYGGNGTTTFGVPDLISRFVRGNQTVAATGGEDTHTLTEAEIPSHVHTYTQPTFGVDIESVGVPDPTGVGNPPVQLNTGATGGGQAHENKPPYMDLYPIIKAFEVALETVQPPSLANAFIIGEVRWLAVDVNNIPAGWFYANGGAFNKNTYPDLFSAIGYTFGGSGDFPLLPDLVHKAAVGADETSPWPLGATGGEETHTLTIAELPAHTHEIARSPNTGTAARVAGGGAAASSNLATTATGGGEAHENMPPYLALTPVIRYES